MVSIDYWTLEDLPDNPTPHEFMMLDRESLEKVPFQRMKWRCSGKGCTHSTTVRDYGIDPYYFLERNSKKSWENPRRYFYNLNLRFWMCSKHGKIYKHLSKSFDLAHIQKKIFDFSQNGLTPDGRGIQ